MYTSATTQPPCVRLTYNKYNIVVNGVGTSWRDRLVNLVLLSRPLLRTCVRLKKACRERNTSANVFIASHWNFLTRLNMRYSDMKVSDCPERTCQNLTCRKYQCVRIMAILSRIWDKTIYTNAWDKILEAICHFTGFIDKYSCSMSLCMFEINFIMCNIFFDSSYMRLLWSLA